MKRIIFMILRLFYISPYVFFKVWWYSNHLEKYDEDTCFQFLKKYTIRANKAGRVIIEAHGIENIPKEDGFVFFPNHQGMYDVLAFLESCPNKFRTIMKREIAEGILTKNIKSMLRGKMIDRDDPRTHIKLIQEIAGDVKDGKNFIMFAEGTRSKKGNTLLDFKGGSFKCATRAKAPVVPVALIDSYKAFDTDSIKPVTVEIHYMKPILVEEYKGMSSNELALMVHDRIQTYINEELIRKGRADEISAAPVQSQL